MATDIEQQIMRAVGLHSHYNWYNGSGSCQGIRHKAVAELAGAINAARDDGALIAPLDPACAEMLAMVSSMMDERDTTLTHTWQAIANCIRAHQEAAHGSETVLTTFVSDYQQRFAKMPGFELVESYDGEGMMIMHAADEMGMYGY